MIPMANPTIRASTERLEQSVLALSFLVWQRGIWSTG